MFEKKLLGMDFDCICSEIYFSNLIQSVFNTFYAAESSNAELSTIIDKLGKI